MCHPLDSILNDDVSIEERDVVIPAELDPSQNTIFPDFEPSRIKELVKINYSIIISINMNMDVTVSS